jgi:hypothetical protein
MCVDGVVGLSDATKEYINRTRCPFTGGGGANGDPHFKTWLPFRSENAAVSHVVTDMQARGRSSMGREMSEWALFGAVLCSVLCR